MAFLDNSGDIILDAVLTDTGRMRLAQGDGSFNISKFALGDDEINYALYNKNHSSGSAYYDLEIMQTPVLEAITNNSAQLKSRLMTIARTNLLFMPTLKLNTTTLQAAMGTVQAGGSAFFDRKGTSANDGTLIQGDKSDSRFYIAVDEQTQHAILNTRTNTSTGTDEGSSLDTLVKGVIQGFNMTGDPNKNMIRIDQGLDTTEISPLVNLDADLLETAFIVELDYRLGRVKATRTPQVAAVNFIDDDNIASYYLTQQGTYINPYSGKAPKDNTSAIDDNNSLNSDPQVFGGPRGNTLQFRIEASTELQSSTYLFTQLGSSNAVGSDIIGLDNNDNFVKNKTVFFLDSTVRVIGANTGFRLDVPVRYVKIK